LFAMTDRGPADADHRSRRSHGNVTTPSHVPEHQTFARDSFDLTSFTHDLVLLLARSVCGEISAMISSCI
jgi:hypothetical protein